MNQNKWLTIGKKLQGRSHMVGGQPCQDHTEQFYHDGLAVAVLADGLGSLPRSDVAAQAATKAVSTWLSSNWPLLKSGSTLKQLQTEILAAAQNAILPHMGLTKDMDCNLAFVVADTREGYAICGHLGDCAVCVMADKPNALTTRGSLANATKTVMTAKPEDLEMDLVQLGPQLCGFILTSDGLESEIYRKRSGMVLKAAQEYFNDVSMSFSVAEAERNLAHRLEKLQKERGDEFDDDLSIVVVAKLGAVAEVRSAPEWLCKCGTRNHITAAVCHKCRTDVLKVYKDELEKYDSLDEMVVWLNAHPEEERRVLERSGMPREDSEDPAIMDLRKGGQTAAVRIETFQTEPEKQPEPAKKLAPEKQPEPTKKTGAKNSSAVSGKRPKETLIDQMFMKGEKKPKPEKSNAPPVPVVSTDKNRFTWKRILAYILLAAALIAVVWICFKLWGPGQRPAPREGFDMEYRDGYYWIGDYEDGEMSGQMMKVPYPLEPDEDGRWKFEWYNTESVRSPLPSEDDQTSEPETTEPSEHMPPVETGDSDGNLQCRVIEQIRHGKPELIEGKDLLLLDHPLEPGTIVTVIKGPISCDNKDWVLIEDCDKWIDWSCLEPLDP